MKGRRAIIATRNYRLYVGYAPEDGYYANSKELREQYFDNLELMADDNPCFLGEDNRLS